MNEPAKTFQDLIVWQKAHTLVLELYECTKGFPKSEIYGLTSQLRRSAVSVPANIAEGFKKRSKKEKAHFLNIAQSSLEESRYYLILARDLGYGDCPAHMDALEEVSRILQAYSNAVRSGFSSVS